MPIVTDGTATERRKRGSKVLFLLLVPPLLVLSLTISAAFRPVVLQIGPTVVVLTGTDRSPGNDNWGGGGHRVTPAHSPISIASRQYQVTDSGHVGYVHCPKWRYVVMWFPGHVRVAEGGE